LIARINAWRNNGKLEKPVRTFFENASKAAKDTALEVLNFISKNAEPAFFIE